VEHFLGANMAEIPGENTKRRALGRGLSALISSGPVPVVPVRPVLGSSKAPFDEAVAADASVDEEHSQVQYRSIELLQASSVQPRQNFDEAELAELSQSIKVMGILQPILVRPLRGQEGRYEIIAGERRWRAGKLAGLSQVPVIIRTFSDEEASEVAIIENVQRSDLNALEEALAYQALADRFGLNHHQIAEKVGKDRSTVTNLLRILALPTEIQELLRQGSISLGHAKALLSVKEPTAQKSLANKIIQEELSVRGLESIVARNVSLKKPSTKSRRSLTPLSDYPEVNDRLRKYLGTKTLINAKSDSAGKIVIDFFSAADLERIVDLICEE
jgi:ParB family transcriptional regulator, chromosome partitioning protein